jgi:hypothetical protein
MSTESTTTETGIGEFGRVLENRQYNVIKEEMTRMLLKMIVPV